MSVLAQHCPIVSAHFTRPFTADLPTIFGMQAITLMGRLHLCREDVVAAMPIPLIAPKELFFFRASRVISPREQISLLEQEGCVQVNPYILISFNMDNPDFSDTFSNTTLWQTADGNFCSIDFWKAPGGRGVQTVQGALDLPPHWYSVGVKK